MTDNETMPAADEGRLEQRVGRPVPERADDGGLTALVMQCAFAVLAGQPTVTISATGKRPADFPRGELLSVGSDGSHNYACHPVQVLAWLHARTSKPHNVGNKRPGTGPLD